MYIHVQEYPGYVNTYMYMYMYNVCVGIPNPHRLVVDHC